MKRESEKYQKEGKKVPQKIKEKESEILFALRAKKNWPKGKGSIVKQNESNDLKEDHYGKINYDKVYDMLVSDGFDSDDIDFDSFEETSLYHKKKPDTTIKFYRLMKNWLNKK